MRVVPRKSDPSMFRDASRSRFACFADQILSLDLPSSSDMHTSPTTLSARRKCDQKQADRVTDQVEDSPPRVVVLFVSGPFWFQTFARWTYVSGSRSLTHSLTRRYLVPVQGLDLSLLTWTWPYPPPLVP